MERKKPGFGRRNARRVHLKIGVSSSEEVDAKLRRRRRNGGDGDP